MASPVIVEFAIAAIEEICNAEKNQQDSHDQIDNQNGSSFRGPCHVIISQDIDGCYRSKYTYNKINDCGKSGKSKYSFTISLYRDDSCNHGNDGKNDTDSKDKIQAV